MSSKYWFWIQSSFTMSSIISSTWTIVQRVVFAFVLCKYYLAIKWSNLPSTMHTSERDDQIFLWYEYMMRLMRLSWSQILSPYRTWNAFRLGVTVRDRATIPSHRIRIRQMSILAAIFSYLIITIGKLWGWCICINIKLDLISNLVWIMYVSELSC